MNIVVTKKKKRHIYAELTEHLFTISCDYPLRVYICQGSGLLVTFLNSLSGQ